MRPRVGHIQFLNCLPIYYGLVEGSGILDLDLVKGLPTELNRRLLDGRLDISPISSVEYGRNPDELLLLPGPTVSCRGPVQSILLLSRRPLDQLDGRPVALTEASATSQVLLKIILNKRYGVTPEYFLFRDDPAEALQRGDAVLLIGDQALEHLDGGPGLTVHDMGQEWWDLTGRGMVFALWAVRREFAEGHPPLVDHVWRLFQSSIEHSSANLRRIAVDAAPWESHSATFLEGYFSSLSFGFEEDLVAGLRRFYDMAAEIGEIPSPPALNFHDPGPFRHGRTLHHEEKRASPLFDKEGNLRETSP
jgi:chorismate dehydratase